MGRLVKKIIGIIAIVASFIPGIGPFIALGLRLVGAFLLQPSTKRPNLAANLNATLSVTANALAARSVIFGQSAIAGQLLYREGATGEQDSPSDMLAVFAIAGYPVDSLVRFELNGRNITADGIGPDGAVTGGPFAGKLWVFFRNGTEATPAFPDLATKSPLGWGKKTRRLTGIPAIALRAKIDETFEGRMEPLSIVKGARLYDPRLDSTVGGAGLQRFADPTTWAWSDNPKLAELLYLRGGFAGGLRLFGMGIPVADIDLDSFAAEANVCDEQVAIKGGGTIKRYTCNGVLNPDTSHRDNLQTLASASGDAPFVSSGQWKTLAAVWRAPLLTLTETDMIGVPSRMQVAADPSERMDVLRAAFLNSDDNKITDAPEYRVGALVDDEKGENSTFPFTSDHRIAQRLMKITFNRANASRQLEGIWRLNAAAAEPGDTVIQSFARYGINAQTFRVGGWLLSPIEDAIGNPGLGVQMILQEDAPSWYAWDAETEEQVLLATDSLARIGDAAQPPTILSISAGVLLIDARANEQFTLQLTEDVTSIVFINIPTERILIIQITQTAAFSIVETAWPASVIFESGVVYQATQVAGRVDTIGLSTLNAGVAWLLRAATNVLPEGGGTAPDEGNPPPPPGSDGSLTATIKPSPVEGFCFVNLPGQCSPSKVAVVTISGGAQPYTALWSKISGSSLITISSTTSLSPVFSIPSGSTNIAVSAVWRCTVTDSAGALKQPQVQVDMERANNL